MEKKKLFNKSTGEILLHEMKIADSFLSRLVGLMGKGIDKEEGLLITPCSSIHCMFMKIPIDVLFLDETFHVIHKISGMKPWRISPIVKGSISVVEGVEGAFARVSIGDQVNLK